MPSRVVFDEAAVDAVDAYAEAYRAYFEGVFADTGIWSQDQIVAQYFAEADRRVDEIYAEIVSRLSQDGPPGRTGTGSMTIPWRTRYLIVEWHDHGDFRIVTGLQVR
jgi:hypothetical protein